MKLTLNVGCGNRTYEEYPKGHKCINLDERRNLSVIDVVADLNHKLPFKKNSFDYILASDILEHFPIRKTKDIIGEWKRVMKKGSTLEIRVPNLEKICEQYVKNKNAQHTSWLLYGGQDYSGNFHYVGFDEVWLKQICSDCGFRFLSCRPSGTNIEMKVGKK